MSIEKFLVIVMFAMSVSAAVARPKEKLISEAQDNTICRTVVDYDQNENRIPRIIKVLKCADDPYLMCEASDGKQPCCRHSSHARFSCTEMYDTVLVADVTTRREYRMNVPVGCSCLREGHDKAQAED